MVLDPRFDSPSQDGADLESEDFEEVPPDRQVILLESSLKEAHATLDEYYQNATFWLRSIYRSLFALVLLAIISFLVRVATGNYPIPVILVFCMFPTFVYFLFSMYKWELWKSRSDIQSAFVASLTSTLRSYTNQN